MWIIFLDPNTRFLHMDKYIYELVEPEDILDYQKHLIEKFPGGRKHEFIESAGHLQPFYTTSDGREFHARNFSTWWRPQTGIAILEG